MDCSSKDHAHYMEAVSSLNRLQSNAQEIEKSKNESTRKLLSIPNTLRMMETLGLLLNDIDALNVIHVTGTKGKGSTCAFAESILRNNGHKTGFFSSPHLIEVRERIRIDGRPISKEMFCSYYWMCYNKLKGASIEKHPMPVYFQFLLLMAFQVFLSEKVDVVLLEVGIGGRYDCTNVVRSPIVCAVASLGLDHQSMLGQTIEEIAWQKGGIFKRDCPAVTVPQPAGSYQVLSDCAAAVDAHLEIAPKLSDYQFVDGIEPRLGINGPIQTINASLAIRLAQIWLQRVGQCEGTDSMRLLPAFQKGLEECHWPGRNQIIKKDSVTYYLDGAHTPRSMLQCVSWFMNEAEQQKSSLNRIGKSVKRVLIFNLTGDRSTTPVYFFLKKCHFDVALFTPNIVQDKDNLIDQTLMSVTTNSMLERCRRHKVNWLEYEKHSSNLSAQPTTTTATTTLYDELFLPNEEKSLNEDFILTKHSNGHSERKGLALAVGSIQDCINLVDRHAGFSAKSSSNGIEEDTLLVKSHLDSVDHLQVLCTGSLHLIGGLLSLFRSQVD